MQGNFQYSPWHRQRSLEFPFSPGDFKSHNCYSSNGESKQTCCHSPDSSWYNAITYNCIKTKEPRSSAGSLSTPGLCPKEKPKSAPEETQVHPMGESQSAPTGPYLVTSSANSVMRLRVDKRTEDFLTDSFILYHFSLYWKSEYCPGAHKGIWLWLLLERRTVSHWNLWTSTKCC